MTDWHRIDDPENPPPMDGTAILVWAQWSWDGVTGTEDGKPYEWIVAEYSELPRPSGAFWIITREPSSDRAVNPKFWCPLPPQPDDV